MEIEILKETPNLLLTKDGDKLEIVCKQATHSIHVGYPKSEDAGKKCMDRLEKYPKQLKKFLQAV